MWRIIMSINVRPCCCVVDRMIYLCQAKLLTWQWRSRLDAIFGYCLAHLSWPAPSCIYVNGHLTKSIHHSDIARLWVWYAHVHLECCYEAYLPSHPSIGSTTDISDLEHTRPTQMPTALLFILLLPIHHAGFLDVCAEISWAAWPVATVGGRSQAWHVKFAMDQSLWFHQC